MKVKSLQGVAIQKMCETGAVIYQAKNMMQVKCQNDTSCVYL